MLLPSFTRRDTDRGHEEVLFDEPVDFERPAVRDEILRTFGPVVPAQIDWRDDQTLWIHDEPDLNW